MTAVSPRMRPTPAPASSPQDLDAAAVFVNYSRKYLGIDMALKTVCYMMRLRALYTAEGPEKHRLETIAINIVDCRMLCNSMKHFGTARQAWLAFQAPPNAGGPNAHIVKLLTVLSFAFRVVEQIFGDLGYLQKNWFSDWSRMYLSDGYKMYKSFGLVCCALLEVIKLSPYIRRALARARARARKVVVNAPSSPADGSPQHSKHVRRVSSTTDCSARGDGGDSGNGNGGADDYLETASIVTSPITTSPVDRSPVAKDADPPKPSMFTNAALANGPQPCDSSRCAMELSCKAPHIPYLVRWTRHQHVRSMLFLTRNIADLLVYSQWIKWYRPYKTLDHICGALSGALGVVIVWLDVEADMLGVPLC